MSVLVDIIHVLACISLILVVLVQAGKGAGMGAAFGGSSQTVFGSSGATSFLVKITRWLALIFIVTSLTITILSSGQNVSSVMSGVTPPTQSETVAEPTMPTMPIQNEGANNSTTSGTSQGNGGNN